MFVLPLALVATACGTPGSDAADTTAAAPSSAAAVTPPGTTQPATPSPDASTGAVALTPLGMGPLKIGMTVAEARSALGTFDLPGGEDPKACLHVRPPSLPRGVLVMVDNGVVVRVAVDSNTVATAEGARIGDSEERIKSLYGARVVTSPHKYTDGHYLTITPAGDSLHRLIFETEQLKVTRFRGGRMPHVAYVEGCS
jgi:hypothetical protein